MFSAVSELAQQLSRRAASTARAEPAYKSLHTLEDRKAESARLRQSSPDRVPVIVEPAGDGAPMIDKSKFLVPDDISLGQLLYVIRKRVRLPPEQAMFVSVCLGRERVLCAPAISMRDLYERSADQDGLLYLEYSIENAFGARRGVPKRRASARDRRP